MGVCVDQDGLTNIANVVNFHRVAYIAAEHKCSVTMNDDVMGIGYCGTDDEPSVVSVDCHC